ncbi:cohesin domain-containing protein [Acetivibrio clariflavus]|uniref:cohesin domain-containing protein n=1 Tax=Acetivibrio clariflavus TaxID=288965 RepID=UPI0004B3CE94|nr:cohesin domain-containing protein [Acetivibrio clariflavus]
MRIRKFLSVFFVIALLISSTLFPSIVFADTQNSSIELRLDKTNAEIGDIITATVYINNIRNFAGYQVNLKYDPEVLQPVTKAGKPYTNSTNPESGTLLNNSEFGAFAQALNNIEEGILNFGKVYTRLEDYRSSAEAESSGSVAVINFKVISDKPTSIVFEDTYRMPGAVTGTMIFDWNGNRISSGYSVVQAGLINSDNQNPVTESNISLTYDKTTAKVGETVKVYLSVNNIFGLSGYQVNLKYDPDVLQPVTSSGKPYSSSTNLSGGDLIKNSDYSPFYQASHNLEEGILNFAASYLNLPEYRASNNAETTGTLGVIEFRVLDAKATAVSFEDSKYMPNSYSGTLLFDWNAEKISGYKINQAGILNSEEQPILNGNVYMELDNTEVEVGDIINASIKVDNIADLAGYQINLSYDPTVLKPVTIDGKDYKNTTLPLKGDIIVNNDYSPYFIASHNLSAGTLNFTGSYLDLEAYRNSGNAETKGTLATISFKVLKAQSTSILFENSSSMPNGISGTMLFDWYGNRILSGYNVNQAPVINVADPTGSQKGKILLELDKTEASFGDIITATLRADGIDNLAGFQVNIKYDPKVLQPVNPATREPYNSNTNPEEGDIIVNSEFEPVSFALHDLKSGILNFSRSYTNLEAYRASESEKSGILAKISFKVTLSETLTYIRLENTGTMPNAIDGTMLFDWYGNRINSGYEVIQPEAINKDNSYKAISISIDKNNPSVGDIINASILILNIDKLAGYQFNIKYDPEVLQPVDSNGVPYTNETIPAAGGLINNEDFGIFAVASHNLEKGILNFSKLYTDLEGYKKSGKPETLGIVATISFKVLSKKITSIMFENTNTMPNAIDGTILFDWNGERIKSGYQVIGSPYINAGSTSDCVKTFSPSPTYTSTPKPENTPIITPVPTDGQVIEDSFITIDFDKTCAKVNDTITATIMVENIDNLAGYQVNLKYDPNMLQPVTSSNTPYTNSSIPSKGTLISNANFGPISAASHKLSEGILNFGRLYTNLADYRASQTPEKTGSLAVVTFKVLKAGDTSIAFENTASMPNAIDGTILFDWYGNKIKSGYKVLQPAEICIESIDPVASPTIICTSPTPTPVVTSTTQPTATPTNVCTSPTPTPVVTPTATSTNPALSRYITIEFDKTSAKVGEIIKAIIKVNEIKNLSGYQINLKYDPDVLQPVKPSGASYTNGTIPSSGTLISNEEFYPLNAVSHDLSKGILNFGKFYILLDDYKNSGTIEDTGTIAVIEFKVLKEIETYVKFENSSSMPNGINGTMLFDTDGNRITSGYTVIQPEKIN